MFTKWHVLCFQNVSVFDRQPNVIWTLHWEFKWIYSYSFCVNLLKYECKSSVHAAPKHSVYWSCKHENYRESINWVVLSVAGTDRSAISLATRAGPVPAHSPSQMVVLWYVGPTASPQLTVFCFLSVTSHCCTLVTLMLSLYMLSASQHSRCVLFLYLFVCVFVLL